MEGQKKNESSGVPAPRKFQQQWSTDTKYKEWLQYDANKQHMTWSFCIKTNKKNPFTTGCTNFRTSTLKRHMSSSDHVNAMIDSFEQLNFRRTVETAMDNIITITLCLLSSEYYYHQFVCLLIYYCPLSFDIDP